MTGLAKKPLSLSQWRPFGTQGRTARAGRYEAFHEPIQA